MIEDENKYGCGGERNEECNPKEMANNFSLKNQRNDKAAFIFKKETNEYV